MAFNALTQAPEVRVSGIREVSQVSKNSKLSGVHVHCMCTACCMCMCMCMHMVYTAHA